MHSAECVSLARPGGFAQMTEEDLSALPVLHPKRLAFTLHWLETECTAGTTTDTCKAAIQQCQRALTAMGVTSEVADFGSNLIKAAGSFSKLIRKRKS